MPVTQQQMDINILNSYLRPILVPVGTIFKVLASSVRLIAFVGGIF